MQPSPPLVVLGGLAEVDRGVFEPFPADEEQVAAARLELTMQLQRHEPRQQRDAAPGFDKGRFKLKLLTRTNVQACGFEAPC
jgi:hypothetical protein